MPLVINTFNINKQELFIKTEDLRQNLPLTLFEWEKTYDKLQKLYSNMPLLQVTTYIELRSKLLAVAENFTTSKDAVDAGMEVRELQADLDEWQDVYFEYMKIITLYAVFLLEQRAITELEQLFISYKVNVAFNDILIFYIQKKLIENDNIAAITLLKVIINTFKSKHHHSVIPTLVMNDYFTGNNLLHIAAQNNNRAAIIFLLPLVDNIDETNNDLQTPLHIACMHSNFAVVQTLLKAGANINIKNKKGENSLHLVCISIKGGISLVKLLLEHKNLDINSENIYKQTPLQLACSNNHYKILKILLKISNIAINSENSNSETLLIIASEHGHDKIVSYLLAQNISNINAQNQAGYTALILACKFKYKKVVTLLLTYDADLNLTSDKGYTALMWACIFNSVNIVKVLLKENKISNINEYNKFGFNAILYATQNSSEKLVGLLLAHGANSNSTNYNNITPLYLACQKQNVTLVKILLKAGANIQFANNNGKNAWHVALESENQKIITILLNYIANNNINFDINLPLPSGGITPLHCAYQNSNWELVALLLLNGANVINQDDIISDILYWMITLEKDEVVKLLVVNEKVDINIKTKSCFTLLMWACTIGNKKILNLLLANMANINHIDNDGNNLLHMAVQNNNVAIIEILHSKNNELITKTNNSGLTPLALAKEKGNLEVIAFLQDNYNLELDIAIINERIIQVINDDNTDIVSTLANFAPFSLL